MREKALQPSGSATVLLQKMQQEGQKEKETLQSQKALTGRWMNRFPGVPCNLPYFLRPLKAPACGSYHIRQEV